MRIFPRILRRYVAQVSREMPGVPLYFMQSNGILCDAGAFRGKDAVLSGPAGGIVGMVRTAKLADLSRVVGVGVGGTSTDESHNAGELGRTFETQVAGVRLRVRMMSMHTVAAGGGSVLHFDGTRLRVGPDSAGANPGPACYRRGGPVFSVEAVAARACFMAGTVQCGDFASWRRCQLRFLPTVAAYPPLACMGASRGPWAVVMSKRGTEVSSGLNTWIPGLCVMEMYL